MVDSAYSFGGTACTNSLAAALSMQTAASQRLLPVAVWGRTRAYLHQPVGGPHDESAHGSQLCEVNLSSPFATAKATPLTSLPGYGQVLSTHFGHRQVLLRNLKAVIQYWAQENRDRFWGHLDAG